jgi:transcriptional regulator GlxA family with amidase domain
VALGAQCCLEIRWPKGHIFAEKGHMPKRAHVIAILVFNDFLLLDAAGPICALEVANRVSGGTAYRTHVIASRAQSVQSSSGIAIDAKGLADIRTFDTLIVVGGNGAERAAEEPRIRKFVESAFRRGRRIASVCSGTYILAAAGLLKGRRATTHWIEAKKLAQRYRDIHVDSDRIFIKQGRIWTSAGVTAGIDLTLALIAEDLGEPAAKSGQSQFSTLLDVAGPQSRFGPTLAWAREHLPERLSVERLAAKAALSVRQFSRAFSIDVGMTPAKAVESLRVETARAQIETGSSQLETIARRVGFGSVDRMRRAFVRAYGQTPQDLRRIARTDR